MRRLLLFVVTWIWIGYAFAGPQNANAQANAYSDLLTAGFAKVYEFNFTGAEAILKSLEEKYPNQPMTSILGMNIIWWQTLSGLENSRQTEKVLAYSKRLKSTFESDERTKKQLDHSARYARILASSFQGRFHLHHQNLVGATDVLHDCVKYLKGSQGQERAFEPFYLTSGLYQYLSAHTREKILYYPISLYLGQGDKGKGKSFLETGQTSKNVVVSTESTYFLMMILGELEGKWSESEKYAKVLTSKYPQNLWYQYFHFKCLLQQKKMVEARKLFQILQDQATSNQTLTLAQQEHFVKIARADLGSTK